MCQNYIICRCNNGSPSQKRVPSHRHRCKEIESPPSHSHWCKEIESPPSHRHRCKKIESPPSQSHRCKEIESPPSHSHRCRVVASLTVPGGQEFHFPDFSLNLDQFILFFLKLYSFSSSFWFSGWAARPPGKALATPLHRCKEIESPPSHRHRCKEIESPPSHRHRSQQYSTNENPSLSRSNFLANLMHGHSDST